MPKNSARRPAAAEGSGYSLPNYIQKCIEMGKIDFDTLSHFFRKSLLIKSVLILSKSVLILDFESFFLING